MPSVVEYVRQSVGTEPWCVEVKGFAKTLSKDTRANMAALFNFLQLPGKVHRLRDLAFGN